MRGQTVGGCGCCVFWAASVICVPFALKKESSVLFLLPLGLMAIGLFIWVACCSADPSGSSDSVDSDDSGSSMSGKNRIYDRDGNVTGYLDKD